jgi:hypothetical protein
MVTLSAVCHIKVSLHHVMEVKLEEIPVIQEFPGVFPMIFLECHLRRQSSSRLSYNPV